MQLEISKSNDLIASSCAGFGINFAVKVPVPALKENRQYLLVRTDHHLVWKIAPGGGGGGVNKREDKVLVRRLVLLKRSVMAFQGLF